MIVSINSIELVKEFAKVVAESGKYVIAVSLEEAILSACK